MENFITIVKTGSILNINYKLIQISKKNAVSQITAKFNRIWKLKNSQFVIILMILMKMF